ncbi:MAG: hydrolase 1, exosortase A system-associated [Croceibacterium sp.]
MTRRHFMFDCDGSQLAATLDAGFRRSGLLWIGGGNEVRCGAFAGQAHLAARLSEAGYPVLRFDRRGVGDSEGANLGFRNSGADIAAALTAFQREQPQLDRVAGFGNCDAASALMLGRGCGCDAVVLANPWTFDDATEEIPPAAIRARYAAKLKDPREWLRLARGGVSLGKLARGLIRATAVRAAPSMLAQEMAEGLDAFDGPAWVLLAGRDRTAQAFQSCWDAGDTRLRHCPEASHAFVEPAARQWLFDQLVSALADKQAGELDVA